MSNDHVNADVNEDADDTASDTRPGPDEDWDETETFEHDYHRDGADRWDAYLGPDAEAHSRGLDFGLLLFRLGLLLLLPHGIHKAMDVPAFVEQVGDNVVGRQAPELVAWIVVSGLIAPPLLAAIGLFTRPVAFLLAALMASMWALETVLAADYTPLTGDGALTGEPALLYLALALPLVFTGAGRWSLDAMRTGGRP